MQQPEAREAGEQIWPRPFQNHIWRSRHAFVKRVVEVVYCSSSDKEHMDELARACAQHENGMHIVAGTGGDDNLCDIVQYCCAVCMSRRIRTPGPVFIDISNISCCEDSLRGVLCATEVIKDGRLYDMRHSYKKWWVDSPQIWVYCDTIPSVPEVRDLIRLDSKWRLWEIDDQHNLVPK